MLSSDLAERIWTESHNKYDAMAIKWIIVAIFICYLLNQ